MFEDILSLKYIENNRVFLKKLGSTKIIGIISVTLDFTNYGHYFTTISRVTDDSL